MSSRIAVVLLLVAATSSACSSDAKPDTVEARGMPATAGDDDGGWAKRVPPEPEEVVVAPAARAAATKPKRAPVQSAVSKPPPPSGGPSQWGDPEAQSGDPLPKRRPMKSAAKNQYEKGLKAAQKFDNKAAKKHFEKALAADPKSYMILYHLGVIADRLGKTNKALQYYNQSLVAQGDHERAATGVARIYMRQGNAAAAVSFVEPLAQRWVRNLYLQALLAETLVAAGRYDRAEIAARAALRRDERFVPAMVALAKSSLARGRDELASSILEQAKKIDKDNPEIHFLQGQLHEKEGRMTDALKSYRRAVRLRPEYAEARMALGARSMASGNYQDALEQFTAVVHLLPKLVAAHLNLGDALRANRQWKLAKQAFDHALRMQQTLPEAHFNLGLMYMSAGEQFPGLSKLEALQRAVAELTSYREQMGSRLQRDDPSASYIDDLQRQVKREQTRLEREAKRKQREAERGKKEP